MAKQVILHNISWFKEWQQLMTRHELQINFNRGQPKDWKSKLDQLCTTMAENVFKENMVLMEKSSREVYKLLNHDNEALSYLQDGNSIQFISTIFKARTESLNLNYKPWNNDKMCGLCDYKVEENLLHFINDCPMYRSIRLKCFGEEQLETQQLFALLNGKNFHALFHYIKEANILRETR